MQSQSAAILLLHIEEKKKNKVDNVLTNASIAPQKHASFCYIFFYMKLLNFKKARFPL